MTITKDDTIVLHGAGDKADITARCDQIRQVKGGRGRGCWGMADKVWVGRACRHQHSIPCHPALRQRSPPPPIRVLQAMETTTSDYDREKLQERLAKLSGARCRPWRGGGGEVALGGPYHPILPPASDATACCAAPLLRCKD